MRDERLRAAPAPLGYGGGGTPPCSGSRSSARSETGSPARPSRSRVVAPWTVGARHEELHLLDVHLVHGKLDRHRADDDQPPAVAAQLERLPARRRDFAAAATMTRSAPRPPVRAPRLRASRAATPGPRRASAPARSAPGLKSTPITFAPWSARQLGHQLSDQPQPDHRDRFAKVRSRDTAPRAWRCSRAWRRGVLEGHARGHRTTRLRPAPTASPCPVPSPP